MRVSSFGHAVYAVVFIGLGVWGLILGDFTAVWQPVAKGVVGREGLVYLCAVISLGSGIGLLWGRTAAAAARVLWVYLLLWWLVFRMPNLFLAPRLLDSWFSCAETLVMIAGAWVLFLRLGTGWDRRWAGFALGGKGLRIARVLYGLALIPFGVAHFLYPGFTASMVPNWLPWHLGWAWFTGIAFVAAGVAVVSGIQARLAAVLSAVQIGLFALLVWVPILMAPGVKSAFQWSETVLSVALAAGAWVVAESYGAGVSKGLAADGVG